MAHIPRGVQVETFPPLVVSDIDQRDYSFDIAVQDPTDILLDRNDTLEEGPYEVILREDGSGGIVHLLTDQEAPASYIRLSIGDELRIYRDTEVSRATRLTGAVETAIQRSRQIEEELAARTETHATIIDGLAPHTDAQIEELARDAVGAALIVGSGAGDFEWSIDDGADTMTATAKTGRFTSPADVAQAIRTQVPQLPVIRDLEDEADAFREEHTLFTAGTVDVVRNNWTLLDMVQTVPSPTADAYEQTLVKLYITGLETTTIELPLTDFTGLGRGIPNMAHGGIGIERAAVGQEWWVGWDAQGRWLFSSSQGGRYGVRVALELPDVTDHIRLAPTAGNVRLRVNTEGDLEGMAPDDVPEITQGDENQFLQAVSDGQTPPTYSTRWGLPPVPTIPDADEIAAGDATFPATTKPLGTIYNREGVLWRLAAGDDDPHVYHGTVGDLAGNLIGDETFSWQEGPPSEIHFDPLASIVGTQRSSLFGRLWLEVVIPGHDGIYSEVDVTLDTGQPSSRPDAGRWTYSKTPGDPGLDSEPQSNYLGRPFSVAVYRDEAKTLPVTIVENRNRWVLETPANSGLTEAEVESVIDRKLDERPGTPPEVQHSINFEPAGVGLSFSRTDTNAFRAGVGVLLDPVGADSTFTIDHDTNQSGELHFELDIRLTGLGAGTQNIGFEQRKSNQTEDDRSTTASTIVFASALLEQEAWESSPVGNRANGLELEDLDTIVYDGATGQEQGRFRVLVGRNTSNQLLVFPRWQGAQGSHSGQFVATLRVSFTASDADPSPFGMEVVTIPTGAFTPAAAGTADHVITDAVWKGHAGFRFVTGGTGSSESNPYIVSLPQGSGNNGQLRAIFNDTTSTHIRVMTALLLSRGTGRAQTQGTVYLAPGHGGVITMPQGQRVELMPDLGTVPSGGGAGRANGTLPLVVATTAPATGPDKAVSLAEFNANRIIRITGSRAATTPVSNNFYLTLPDTVLGAMMVVQNNSNVPVVVMSERRFRDNQRTVASIQSQRILIPAGAPGFDQRYWHAVMLISDRTIEEIVLSPSGFTRTFIKRAPIPATAVTISIPSTTYAAGTWSDWVTLGSVPAIEAFEEGFVDVGLQTNFSVTADDLPGTTTSNNRVVVEVQILEGVGIIGTAYAYLRRQNWSVADWTARTSTGSAAIHRKRRALNGFVYSARARFAAQQSGTAQRPGGKTVTFDRLNTVIEVNPV